MKPILISGIQPTGRLHLGNYLGALKNFVELQNSNKYQCYFFIADLHSLTENFEPKEKHTQILELVADYLAAGLDSKKSLIFLQSEVPTHSELTWILNTIAPMGELNRMTQFKDKKMQVAMSNVSGKIISVKGDGAPTKENTLQIVEDEILKYTNVGLFDYPVLMAADILLYDTKFVPVGDDQLQHLELTRTLARKFNSKFGKTFVEPKALLTKSPRVMSLDNPLKKMAKSRPAGCLFLDDEPAVIKKKIMSAVTDSGSEIKHRKDKPAISNLLEIYSALNGKTIQKLENEFRGKGYAEFKRKLAEEISNYFADFRKKKKSLMSKPSNLKTILQSGSQKAAAVAEKKMAEVKKKIGIAL